MTNLFRFREYIVSQKFLSIWLIVFTICAALMLGWVWNLANENSDRARENRILITQIEELQSEQTEIFEQECYRQELRDDSIIGVFINVAKLTSNKRVKEVLRRAVEEYRPLGELCAASIPKQR